MKAIFKSIHVKWRKPDGIKRPPKRSFTELAIELNEKPHTLKMLMRSHSDHPVGDRHASGTYYDHAAFIAWYKKYRGLL